MTLGDAGRHQLSRPAHLRRRRPQSSLRTSIAAMIEEITEMMIEPATAEPKEATSSPSGT